MVAFSASAVDGAALANAAPAEPGSAVAVTPAPAPEATASAAFDALQAVSFTAYVLMQTGEAAVAAATLSPLLLAGFEAQRHVALRFPWTAAAKQPRARA
jgi:hypothetical protein